MGLKFWNIYYHNINSEKGNPKSNFIKLSSTEHGCSKPIRIGRVPFH